MLPSIPKPTPERAQAYLTAHHIDVVQNLAHELMVADRLRQYVGDDDNVIYVGMAEPTDAERYLGKEDIWVYVARVAICLEELLGRGEELVLDHHGLISTSYVYNVPAPVVAEQVVAVQLDKYS